MDGKSVKSIVKFLEVSFLHFNISDILWAQKVNIFDKSPPVSYTSILLLVTRWC